jgi:hypothetical protein
MDHTESKKLGGHTPTDRQADTQQSDLKNKENTLKRRLPFSGM